MKGFKFFFDANGKALVTALNRAQRRNLSLYGRDIRQGARRSIKKKQATRRQLENARMKVRNKKDRKRKERALNTIRRRNRITSDPGSPPFSHSPDDMIRDIRYGYDSKSMTVVAGYMKTKRGKTPQVLEHGGTTSAYVFITRPGQNPEQKRTTIRVAARPAIWPQHGNALDKYNQRLKDSVK